MTEPKPPWWQQKRWRVSAVVLTAPPLAAGSVAAAALAKAAIDRYLAHAAPPLGPGSVAAKAFWLGAFTLFGAAMGTAVGAAVAYMARRRRDRP